MYDVQPSDDKENSKPIGLMKQSENQIKADTVKLITKINVRHTMLFGGTKAPAIADRSEGPPEAP